jgi:hypothetical protein
MRFRNALLNVLLFAAAAFVVGCLVQPKDAVTGEAFGPPVSVDRVPTTSPAGNPVAVTVTKEIDYGRIAQIVDEKVKPLAVAATPPPYQPATYAGVVAAVAGLYELARKREQKALETPPPGTPPKP